MTSSTAPTARAPQVPAFAKAMMQFQAFLLRRNWMGKLGDEIMVLTVTGRKSGKTYSTPIGYLLDPEVKTAAGQLTIIALTGGAGGASNWYRNVLRTPEARLEIKGRALRARGTPVQDEGERRRIFALYRRERRANFPRLFGVSADAPEAELEQALATRVFIRFHPLD